MHSRIFLLFSLVFSCSAAQAGEYLVGSKNPLGEKLPIEECIDIGAEITAGYLTDHDVHGLRVNRDAVHIDVNYTFDSFVPLTFGVAHVSGIDAVFPFGTAGPLDLTDFYLQSELATIGGFDLSLRYLHRLVNFTGLPGLDISYDEIGLELRRDFGFADLILASNLGLDSRNSFFNAGGGDGWVHTAGLEKTIPLCGKSDLVLGGEVGYHDGFYFSVPSSSGWSHYSVKASLPVKLNCRTTVTPFIEYTGVQQWGVYFRQGDALHGGVSVNVSF